MPYGSEKIKWERDVYGMPFLAGISATLTDEDIEVLKKNGFINLGPTLTIKYKKGKKS